MNVILKEFFTWYRESITDIIKQAKEVLKNVTKYRGPGNNASHHGPL